MPDSISHWSQTCNCLILGFLYNIAHTFIVYLDFLFVPGSMLIDTIVKGIGSPRFPYHHSNFLTQHLRVFPQSGSAVPETGFVIYCCCCCCKVASVVSDSVRPHKRQPTRLRCPWDSPVKNTGLGCHFLLQWMKVKSESEVSQLCPTLSNPIGVSPPGSSVHGIFQARVLEWGAIAFFAVIHSVQFSSVQSLSRVRLFVTPWIAARQASLSITNSRSSLRLTSIESVMPSSHLIFCCPLLLLPPIPPSVRVFSNESTLRMRWPKY